MGFNRPTLQQIIDRIRADIDSLVPGADTKLRRSVLDVFARALGGAVHLAYGAIEFVSRQVFPDTAESEFLARWAAIWGVERLAATFASGTVKFTGSNGATIPAGTLLKRSDDFEFTTDALATIAGGEADVGVAASSSGLDGNADIGTELSLIAPIAGVDPTATVIDDGSGEGLSGGNDIESDDSLRTRLLQRIQNPPLGGSEADYISFALEVPGVTRVWVFPLNRGLGTVDIFFVRDNDPSLIPGASEVQDVQDKVDELRPVTADALVIAPTPIDLDIDVQLEPNTTEVQDAVKDQIRDLLLRQDGPGGTVLISKIREAISLAIGEEDHILIAPAANVVLGPGELAVEGAFAFAPIP